MVKGKIAKKISDDLLVPALKGAKLGGTAVVIEKATDVVDNRAINTIEGAAIGAVAGSVLGPVGAVAGGAIGGATGWILGDQTTVFPVDMICIPAYQSFMIQGQPAFQIYARAGETLIPTGGNVQDVQEVVMSDVMAIKPKRSTRRKGAGLPKKYAKMGFKKGWREYKKTSAYKKKLAAKKRKGRKR